MRHPILWAFFCALLFSGLAFALSAGGAFLLQASRFKANSTNRLAGGPLELNPSMGAPTIGASLSGGVFGVTPAPVFGRGRVSQAAPNLERAHAYPVPFRPAIGHAKITFTDLPRSTEITVYTIIGERVRRLEKNDSGQDLVWDPVTNEASERVASGLYLFLMRDRATGEKRIGKLIVIR